MTSSDTDRPGPPAPSNDTVSDSVHLQAIVVDFSLAIGGMLLTGFGRGLAGIGNDIDQTVGTLALATYGFLVFVYPLFLTEHRSLLSTLNENRPVSFLVVFVGTFVLTLVLALGRTVLPAPVSTLLFGMSAGLLGYRLLFGLVHPLPAQRVQQARLLRGSDPFEDSRSRPPR